MKNILTDSVLIKNFSSLLFSNFFIQGMRFLTVLILARGLGNEQFGVYNYFLMLVSLCAILVEFGLKNYGIREFSQNSGSKELRNHIIKIRSVVALGATALVTLLIYQAFRRTDLLLPSLLFSLSLFADATLVDFIAISQERLHLQAVSQSLQAAFYLVAVYCLSRSNLNLLAMGVLFSLSHALMAAVYFMKTKEIPSRSSQSAFSNIGMQAVIVGGLPFLLANILSTLQAQMDIFLLGQFHFDFLLGDYSACLKLLSIPIGVVSAFMGAIQPRLARISHDKALLKAELKKYVVWMALVASLVVVIYWFGAGRIVPLVFGDKYFLAQIYLGPLSCVSAMFMMALLPMHALFVSREIKTLLQITTINFLLGAVVISFLLYRRQPELLPWGMLLVQTVLVFQSWRHFLKK